MTKDITGELTGPVIRKLLKLGHSYAITLPPKWVRTHTSPARPYITTTTNPDGSITVRALAFDPAGQPDPVASDRVDHAPDRSERSPARRS